MNIRTILVDDEPLALQVLESYIARLDNIEIVGKFTDAVKAFSFLQQNRIDLLFLDIQMPELNGMNLLKTLAHPPAVIITTAFREYAVESFELDVTDYLLKPIPFERFLKSIQKYYRMHAKPVSGIQQVMEDTAGESEFIFIKENKKKVKLELDKIYFIESLKDYVRFHTSHKKIVSKMSMSELETSLPSDRFMRVHRSFIIPIQKIEAYSACSVDINSHTIPIGNTYKSVVLKRLEFLLG